MAKLSYLNVTAGAQGGNKDGEESNSSESKNGGSKVDSGSKNSTQGPNREEEDKEKLQNTSMSFLKSNDEFNSHQFGGHNSNNMYGYVHSDDNLGLVLVSGLLTGNRYYIPWFHSMTHALRAKRKLNFILLDVSPSEDSPEYERWTEDDSLVFSWLINSMTNEVAETIMYASSARALWLELKHHFGARMIQDLDEKDMAMQFLSGLSSDYEHVRNQILLTNPIPNINDAFSMVQTIEI